MTVRRQERRGTAAQWTTANPVLAAGEIGVESSADPTVASKMKVGDGTTAWTALPYQATGSGGGTVVPDTTPVSARIDIVTAGQAPIVSKVDYLAATLTISGVPGVDDFSGVCQIRGRGNSTWLQPKKPYKIKMPSKVSLMGMPPMNDWALLANAFDVSLVNNALALDIGALATGLAWTPRYRTAEVYLNGVYDGLYQLVETTKFDVNRINATKATGATGLALTGAYSLEVEASYRAPTFVTDAGTGIITDDPDGTNATQLAYIRDHLNDFEDVLFGSGFANPTTGYAAWINPTSFADWYLIEELFLNGDSDFRSSCKFVKQRDTDNTPAGRGKLSMGPLWDFDLSLGLNLDNGDGGPHTYTPTSWYTRPNATWINRLYDDATFRALIAARWTALKAAITARGGVAALVDAVTAVVASRGLADQERWNYDADWAALAAAKKAFLTARIAFFDAHITDVLAVPAAPTSVVATAGPASASVAFTPPTGDGVPITEYIVTASTSQTATGSASPIVVTGLTPSTPVTFTVRAANALGSGPASAPSAAVTPTPGGGGGFSPADVSGLTLWFDATQETGRVNNDLVPTMVNREGTSSRNATHNTGAFYRDVSGDGITLPPSGLPVYYTNDGKAYLGATGLTVASGVTVICVFATAASSIANTGLFCAAQTDDYADGMTFGIGAGPDVEAMMSGGAGRTDNTVALANPLSIFEWTCLGTVRDGADSDNYQDGVLVGSDTGTVASTRIDHYSFGGRYYGGNATGPNMAGGIAEAMVFNRALSDVERKQVEVYLANKWGTPDPPA